MAARSKKPAHSASHRFDIVTLREFAGDKVFARGVEYHEDGEVEIVSIDRARVVARVTGSEIYRCELNGTGKKFSGGCSCPAFSDWGFCKHLVATALSANALDPGASAEAKNRLSNIREHLRAKGIDSLIEMILALAEDDRALFKELELAAAMATADEPKLFAEFKKAITDATRTSGYIEYRKARAWADKISGLLDQISGLTKAGRAELVLRLLDHFFLRMDEALLNIDDSDGEGGAVYAKACQIHLEACDQAKPDPIALARELFARERETDWDFFYGASDTYADVLGDTGLAEYRRLAGEAWQGIKPLRAGQRRTDFEEASDRDRLAAMLERFAERDGDVDARIAIRSKNLSSAYDYFGIAQLCVDNGRDAEAMKWAEEGTWQFEDDPDERLVLFTADLYCRAGRKTDADGLLWQTFERDPSIELYRKLKRAAGPGKPTVDAARDRAIALLQAKVDKVGAKAGWDSPQELLVEILMSEKLFAEAWKVVRRHECSRPRLLALAKASEQDHPHEALSVYAQDTEQLARFGGQENYEAAGKLITRMQAIRQRLGASADHAAFLADFVTRHKAKRNLMKILQPDKADGSRRHAGSATAR
jgi:uncharacterized Zn finger protein